MPQVAVVSDSTGPLPAAVAGRYDVPLVPLYVLFDDASFRDGVDLTADAFYRRLAESRGRVRTSQPSPGDFLDVFQRVAGQARDIVCITLSSKLSGTCNAALQAAELAMESDPGLRVRVVDSLMASGGHQLMTLKAAERAAAGDGIDEVAAAALALRPRIHLWAVFATLDYLVRGGRVGRARGLVGQLLGLKPILTLKDGEVDAAGTARGQAAGLRRIEDETERALTGRGRLRTVVVHAGARERAEEWAERIRRRFRPDDLFIEPFTPVLGVHSGPGLLGLISCEDDLPVAPR